jgi:hypothetical protein
MLPLRFNLPKIPDYRPHSYRANIFSASRICTQCRDARNPLGLTHHTPNTHHRAVAYLIPGPSGTSNASVGRGEFCELQVKRRKSSSARTYRWSIYRLRGTPAAFIGSVEAADEKGAVDAAIREFGIDDPQHQRRLIAQRQD